MAFCEISGRPDLYGLGIRLAFYIQWSGAVIVSFFDETQLRDIRLIGILLSAAMSLSTVISAASSSSFSSSSDQQNLQPADVYITVLLAAGIYIFLVPLYLLRAFTLCNPYWNPFRWTGEKHSPLFDYCNFILLVAVSSIGVWYYTTFLPPWWESYDGADCDQYGFFFSQVSLRDKAYVAFNALLYLVIIIVCAAIILKRLGLRVKMWTKERRRRKIRTSHIALLRVLKTISNLAVLAVLIAAVELSIQFNNLAHDVSDLSTSAQTIPLFLSAGIVLRVFFKLLARLGSSESRDSDDDGDDYDYDDAYSSYYSGDGGGPPPPTAGAPPPGGHPDPPPPPPPAHMA